jgi:outer membrane autotransporter protein
MGLDYTWSDFLTLGTLLGFQMGNAEVDDFGSDMDTLSYLIGGYGQWTYNGWFVDAMMGYTYHDYDNTRKIVLQNARSDTGGHQFTTHLNGGYDFRFGADNEWLLGVLGGIQYSYLEVEGYSERGSDANLNVGDQIARSLRSQLGITFSRKFAGDWGWITPELRAAWHHEFLDEERSVRAAFQSEAFDPFVVETDAPDRDFALVGLGIESGFPWCESLRFYIDYDLQIGQEDFLVHSGSGGIKIRF